MIDRYIMIMMLSRNDVASSFKASEVVQMNIMQLNKRIDAASTYLLSGSAYSNILVDSVRHGRPQQAGCPGIIIYSDSFFDMVLYFSIILFIATSRKRLLKVPAEAAK